MYSITAALGSIAGIPLLDILVGELVILWLVVGVYVYEIYRRHRAERARSPQTVILRDTKAKTDQMIAAAAAETEHLRSVIEEELRQSAGADQAQVAALFKTYEARLEQLFTSMAQKLDEEHSARNSQLNDLVAKMTAQVAQEADQARSTLTGTVQKTSDVGRLFEEKMTDLLQHTSEQVGKGHAAADQQYATLIKTFSDQVKANADAARASIDGILTHAGEVSHALEGVVPHLTQEIAKKLEEDNAAAMKSFTEVLTKIESRTENASKDANSVVQELLKRSGELIGSLNSKVHEIEEQAAHLMSTLTQAGEEESKKNAEYIREEMKKLTAQLATSVTGVAQQLEKIIEADVKKEFEVIAKEVDTYRRARIDMVEEHILLLIEKTSQIALQKELSVTQQSELVYRALEEAKDLGVFI